MDPAGQNATGKTPGLRSGQDLLSGVMFAAVRVGTL